MKEGTQGKLIVGAITAVGMAGCWALMYWNARDGQYVVTDVDATHIVYRPLDGNGPHRVMRFDSVKPGAEFLPYMHVGDTIRGTAHILESRDTVNAWANLLRPPMDVSVINRINGRTINEMIRDSIIVDMRGRGKARNR